MLDRSFTAVLLLLVFALFSSAKHCEQPFPMPSWVVGKFKTVWPDLGTINLESQKFAGTFTFPNGSLVETYIMRSPLELKKVRSSDRFIIPLIITFQMFGAQIFIRMDAARLIVSCFVS